MVIRMVVGVDVSVVVGVVVDVVVIAGVGVVVGRVIIPGLIVTVGAALVVPQAERTTATQQNNKQGFINLVTSREIIDLWSGIRLDLLVISQI